MDEGQGALDRPGRRRFLAMIAASVAAGAPLAGAATDDDAERLVLEPDDIDPYFLDADYLDPARVTDADREAIRSKFAAQERRLAGKTTVRARGTTKHGPGQFAYLRWQGDLDDGAGRFIGPLSVVPSVAPSQYYSVNAQILGFNLSSEDWSAGNEGTLTIELRSTRYDEPLTNLFAQPFDVNQPGYTAIGAQMVCQRDGVSFPMICEQPLIDIRIQLLRQKKGMEFFRKVLRAAAWVAGVGGAPGVRKTSLKDVSSNLALQIPNQAKEAVALSQAVFGNMSDSAPLWKGGFTSFALLESAGAVRLDSGFWVVVDDSALGSLQNARLADRGGRAALLVDGKPIDANYLVLSFTIQPAQLRQPAFPGQRQTGPAAPYSPAPAAAPQPKPTTGGQTRPVPAPPPPPPTDSSGDGSGRRRRR